MAFGEGVVLEGHAGHAQLSPVGLTTGLSKVTGPNLSQAKKKPSHMEIEWQCKIAIRIKYKM